MGRRALSSCGRGWSGKIPAMADTLTPDALHALLSGTAPFALIDIREAGEMLQRMGFRTSTV